MDADVGTGPAFVDALLAEIREATYAEALEGASSVLVVVGAAILSRMGYAPAGKADVKFDVGDMTTITITWRLS